ncbi:MAG TPA: DUF3826 domain-containing protein [Verrucomicrobiae bacterium]|nr:DUF3826 domain-containing protein [Verrucomicrobiae bacterium]
MKYPFFLNVSLVVLLGFTACTLSVRAAEPATNAMAAPMDAVEKSDSDQEKKAAEWVAALKLTDAAKEKRVTEVIATHLKAIRDWHNDHSYTNVPPGIDPAVGRNLSVLDRQVLMDSALPRTVHQDLMAGLRKDLSEDQVEIILDKYTVGKVAFTMGGYKSIVPDLTADEEKAILVFLKQAREQAVDFKNIKEISAIFEIYKTKCEQYLNSNGRNWHSLYKAYTDMIKAKKAAATVQPAKSLPDTNSVPMAQ